MNIALNEAFEGVNASHGGPFGAVIIRDNALVASSHNQVLKDTDPTAHAEIMAIRRASHLLNTPHLTDCTLYTTCEPCPMCLGAIYWAKIPLVYFGCTNEDAGQIGFIDDSMHQLFNIKPSDELKMIQLHHTECMTVFDHWKHSNLPLY